MSDWALGRKLNSRVADIPLNHLIWLNDYKTYGENSYVFQDKDILHELYRSPIAANDGKILDESLSYILENEETRIAAWLLNLYELRNQENVFAGSTIEEVVNDTNTLGLIFQSKAATAFAKNEKVGKLVSLNADALKAASLSNSAMSALESNQAFKENITKNGSMKTEEVSSAVALSLENIYLYSVYTGYAMYDNSYAISSIRVIIHGSTGSSTIYTGGVSGIDQSETITSQSFLKKFNKDSTIGSGGKNSVIKYIQLDEVV